MVRIAFLMLQCFEMALPLGEKSKSDKKVMIE
jgi:hypothetical protein